MGMTPRASAAIFASSLSTQITFMPRSARQAPVTRPTCPVPTMQMFMTRGRSRRTGSRPGSGAPRVRRRSTRGPRRLRRGGRRRRGGRFLRRGNGPALPGVGLLDAGPLAVPDEPAQELGFVDPDHEVIGGVEDGGVVDELAGRPLARVELLPDRVQALQEAA